MKKKSLKYQFAGMLLILLSAGFQIFVERPIAGIKTSGQLYEQEQKLNAMWGTLLDMYTHEYPDRAGMTSFANVKAYDRHFTTPSATKRIDWQVWITSSITAIVFLIGSVLVIYSKWLEIQSVDEAADSTSSPRKANRKGA